MSGGRKPEELVTLIAAIARDSNLSPERKNEHILQLTASTSQSHSLNGNANETDGNGSNDLSPQERLSIIADQLQETLNMEILEDVLVKQNRTPVVYWGTATTGRPHCGYFVPMLKIASFLRAGLRVKVLLADIHAFLDNLKAPIELVKWRSEYYKLVIIELLKAVGVSVDRLEFVLGSSYQLSQEYMMDLLRMCTIVTEHDAKKAGAEVVKQVDSATLSGLIYPLMQALDEQYLGVDAQFGGVDQRKIFTLAKDVLPKLGYKERAHLMNPMVPGLAGGKMSSSEPDSKIDVLDAPAVVTKKLKKAFAVPKKVEGNGILSFVEYVLLPAGILRSGTPRFVVERREGEPLVYENISKMHQDYREDILTPQLLKAAVTKALNELLEPVQAAFNASKEWQEIQEKAYPPAPAEEKKVKVKKDRGTRFPGSKVEVKPDGVVEGSGEDQVNLASSATEALSDLRLGNKST